ncbi:MAG TPA: PaaI family thioesterase [bacterium]|nr:PaaI family thioesterase [bacterium]
MADADIAAKLKERLERSAARGFGKTCGFRLVSFGEGKARVELDVADGVQNLNGTLHGGAIATLIDDAGTVAIMSADREARPGVSTDLNVSFFAPAPGGSTVYADAAVLRIGKTLAFVTVDVKRKSDDVLVAQGRMTKFQGA